MKQPCGLLLRQLWQERTSQSPELSGKSDRKIADRVSHNWACHRSKVVQRQSKKQQEEESSQTEPLVACYNYTKTFIEQTLPSMEMRDFSKLAMIM